MRQKTVPDHKPSLPYLETHLTDHCNLNCKGCAHFSPIAKEWFADPDEHQKDMIQLSKLFSNIETIRLMGGEPLLHPNIEPFLSSTRASFPEANIRIVTNGILLSNMPEQFWDACRANNIQIEITFYPPMASKIAELSLSKAKGIEFRLNKKKLFKKFVNLEGNSDIARGFHRCRRRMTCPMLRQGRIYCCFLPAVIGVFNKHFQAKIPSDGFIDIYELNLSGERAADLLNTPSQTCAYCTGGWDRPPTTLWTKSEKKIDEWTVA